MIVEDPDGNLALAALGPLPPLLAAALLLLLLLLLLPCRAGGLKRLLW